MIKETGQVVKQSEEVIWVETQVTSACTSCAAKANCGTSAIASSMSNKAIINKVANTQDAKVGDWVEIGIPESSFLQASFLLYILPLLFALAFAVISQLWLSQFIEVKEWLVILMTFIGGATGFLVSRNKISRSELEQQQPQLISVLDEVQAN